MTTTKIRFFNGVALAAVCLWAFPGVCRAGAELHAVDVTSAGSIGNGTLYSVGWDFTVTSPITVTALGQFDPDSNPQANSVALYQRGGAKLLSASVLTTSPLETSGIYPARYVAVASTVLSAGDYVIMSTQNGKNFIGPNTLVTNTATWGTGITWNKGVAFAGAAGPLPDTAPASWAIEQPQKFRYFGPTFKFTTAPLAPPTQLAIPSVNGGVVPTAGTAFSLVVQARDDGGAPQNVTNDTAVSLSLKTGTGSLGGTGSGTIAAGTSSVTISGVTYSTAESGVVMTATVTSGDSLPAADSAAFTVAEPPPPSVLGKIMPMGDSITRGTPVLGGYRDPLYTLLTNRLDTFTFVGTATDNATQLLTDSGQTHHEGHSGWVITYNGVNNGLDENLGSWIGSGGLSPDKIILMIGVNDIRFNNDIANAPTRLSTLINHIYGFLPSVKLYVASLTPLAGLEAKVYAFNTAVPGVVASHQALGRNVVYVPMYEAMNINTDLSDGVHPNALGYQHMAGTWDVVLNSSNRITTTTLDSSANPSIYGQQVIFTATVKTNGVTAADATSNIVFYVNSTAMVSAAVSGGSATYTNSTLPVGTNTIQAVYIGDSTYAASLASFVQSNGITTTTLDSSANPSIYGQQVIFTATVKTNGVTAADATSNIVFYVDGTAKASTSVSGGSATYTNSAFATGIHAIQAVYNGDGAHAASLGSLAQTNNPDPEAPLATTGFGQAGAGPYDYNTASNWVENSLPGNGIWDASLTLTAEQNTTFADDTPLTTGFEFNYSGDFPLTLSAAAAGTKTITLGGDIGLNTGGGSSANVTIGDASKILNVNLGGSARTMTVAESRTLTIKNVVSNGGMIKAGTGTVILSGANTYSSGTTINSGTLQLGTGAANGTFGSGTYSIASGGMLRLNYSTASSPTWANVSGAGTFSLFSTTYGDWGSGLPGSFSGTLQIEKGRVITTATGDHGLGNAASVVVLSGAQLAVSAGGTFTNNLIIAGVGDAAWGVLRLANQTLTTTLNGNIALSGSATIGARGTGFGIVNGVISGGSSADLTVGATVNINGVVTFNGANTYTGGTVLGGGTLVVTGNLMAGSDGNLGHATTSTGTLTFNGGALQYAGTGQSTTIDRPWQVMAGQTATFDVSTGNTLAISTGAYATSGGVTKSGVGTLVLSAADSSYSGVTTIDKGVLEVTKLANGGAASSIGSSANSAVNLVFNSLNGPTLRYTGSGDSTDRLIRFNNTGYGQGATIDASGSGALKFTNAGSPAWAMANRTFTLNLKASNTNDNTMGLAISNNGTSTSTVNLSKQGPGKWILTGVNAYGGGTGIEGVLEVGGSGKLGNGSYAGTINNSGTFIYSSTVTQTLSGVISGTGAVVKASSGMLILATTNTYTGVTEINGGTLTLGASGFIASSTNVMIATGAVFDVSAQVIFSNGVSQAYTVAVDPAGSGTAGLITAAGMDVSKIRMNFTASGALNDSAYVFVHYTSLSGHFDSITCPLGYVIDYNYLNGKQIALVRNNGTLLIIQ